MSYRGLDLNPFNSSDQSDQIITIRTFNNKYNSFENNGVYTTAVGKLIKIKILDPLAMFH